MSDACCGGGVASELPESGSISWKAMAAAVATLAWATGVAVGQIGLDAASDAAFWLAIVAGGSTFAPDALRALVRGRLGVGLLMTIAGVGSLLLGQIGEAAALAFLFAVSEGLEEWAVNAARRSLKAVLALVPDSATVRRGGEIVEVSPDELGVGDLLVVRAGERIAVDGTIRTGQSSLDTSAVTGESIPVECGPADEVLAGTLNGNGLLEIEVTAPVATSTLARIVEAVEEARDRKGQAQRLADRIARPLVPAILIVAATIAVIGSALGDSGLWIERALVVLVAASPCALAISVPVTVFAAIGAATRSGLVIKGGAALEALATIRTVVFDKTGTLTGNRPTVVEVVTGADWSPAAVLARAAALEHSSDHPLATAIIEAASDPTAEATEVQTHPGRGLTGQIDGTAVRVGKPEFVDPGSLTDEVRQLQRAGATIVVVEVDERPVGAIAIRDEIRPEAPSVVTDLRTRHGLDVTLLSGDHPTTVDAIGRAAGIDDCRGSLLPGEKAQAIRQLQERGPVAMVGDGINDAPALATADVGIAMGTGGTDVAIETADIAIVGDQLVHLADAIDHARRVRRIMVQNLVLSGLIIAVLVPVAATGLLGLGAVVIAHEVAEVGVILNGLRARRDLVSGDHTPPDQVEPGPGLPTSAAAATV